MHDDLEDRLRTYRPAGPPPDLRGRIVTPAPRRFSVLEWLPAAAALILAVVFSWLASNERRIVDSHFTPVPPIARTLPDRPVAEQPFPQFEELQR